MTSCPADRPIRQARKLVSSGELRRLRKDVVVALAIKVLAILALAWAFFGPSHQPHVDPSDMFLNPIIPANK